MAKSKKPAKKSPTNRTAKPAKKAAKPKSAAKSKAPPKAARPVKAAEPRNLARQTVMEIVKPPSETSKALDDLVTDAYNKTATYQAAKTPMNEARARLHKRMKEMGVTEHETEEGVVAKVKTIEEKLSLSGPKGGRVVEVEVDYIDPESE